MPACRALLLATHLVARAAAFTPGTGVKCVPGRAGYSKGLHTINMELDGQKRRFVLFVPDSYNPEERLPLWLLAPGAYDTAEKFVNMSGMIPFANERSFAFAALNGVNNMVNVVSHARESGALPDDIKYTSAVLREATEKLCIDTDRIRCTGYSRGARFCSRLASELSSFVTGIAPVGGVRYPTPNNATRPMPIIALHGTEDRINPYWGNGDPTYWHESVPEVLHNWADFNGCKTQRWERKTPHVVISEHGDCSDGTSVVLIMIQGDGHTWPGSPYKFVEAQFGKMTDEIDANAIMWEFFMEHPRPSVCKTAVAGTACYEAVQSAMRDGLQRNPEWSRHISATATFEEFQSFLHIGYHADCPLPCRKEGDPAPQPVPAPPPVANDPAPAPAPLPPQSTTTPTAEETETDGEAEGNIEGQWTHKLHPGRFAEVIKDGTIYWDKGPKTKISAEGKGKFSTVWQGRTFNAHLEDGRLEWNDGDVWIRHKDIMAGDKPKWHGMQQDPTEIQWDESQKFSTERIATTSAEGSWLARIHVFSNFAASSFSRCAAAAAAAVGVAAMLLALALGAARVRGRRARRPHPEKVLEDGVEQDGRPFLAE